MTITSTRRSVRSLGRMTPAQASAWWAVHGSEVGGTRGEFDGLDTFGTLDHHISGDGWGQLGGFVPLDTHERSVYRSHPDRETFERRIAGRRAADRRRQRQAQQAMADGARQTRQRATDGGRLLIAPEVHAQQPLPYGGTITPAGDVYEAGRPGVQRGRTHLTTVPDSFAQVGQRLGYEISAPLEQGAQDSGRSARRVAQTQMTRFGRLLPDAPILGQPIPRAMWFDRSRGDYAAAHRRRDMHLADAFPVDPEGDLSSEDMVADTSMVEMIDFEDLRQLLRSHGVTEREMEALEERAAGVAQSDRSGAALRRARERAGRIYTQWQRLEYCFAWSAV